MGLFAILGHALIGVVLAALGRPAALRAARPAGGTAHPRRPGSDAADRPAGRASPRSWSLVVWSSLLVAFAISQADGDLEKLRYAFVAAGAAPGVFGLAQVMADPDAERPQTSWELQLVGVGIVVATAVAGVHGWNY